MPERARSSPLRKKEGVELVAANTLVVASDVGEEEVVEATRKSISTALAPTKHQW